MAGTDVLYVLIEGLANSHRSFELHIIPRQDDLDNITKPRPLAAR